MLNIIRPTSLLYSVIWKIILDYRAIEKGTNRPWNESSLERIVQGTKRPKFVFRSWERNVLGTKSPVTLSSNR